MSTDPPPPKPSRRPSPAPPRNDYRSPKAGSGQHPAVRAYRDKLQSIHENTVPRLAEIDEDLAQFLIEDDTPSEPSPPTKGPTR